MDLHSEPFEINITLLLKIRRIDMKLLSILIAIFLSIILIPAFIYGAYLIQKISQYGIGFLNTLVTSIINSPYSL